MLNVPPSTTVASLKEEVLSALLSTVVNASDGLPNVSNDSDFELCKALKDKGRPNGEYEPLETSKQLKDCALASYDTLYIQFRGASNELLPVVFQSPSIDDDDDEQPSEAEFGTSGDRKGKRKAQDD